MAQTILICSNVYPPHFVGGAELIAHYQAKLLQQRGYHVFVFAGENAAGGDRYSVRDDYYDGLPIFRARLWPQDYRTDAVNYSHPEIDASFDKLLDRVTPDVVHMHNLVGLSAGIIHLAKRRGIRTILTLHDYWGFCFKNTLIKHNNEVCQDYSRCSECSAFISDGADRLIPIGMRRNFLRSQLSDVDAFISPSLYLAAAYVKAGIPIQKINVIWNGIDVARFSSLSKAPRRGRVRFTFVGHFGLHKGIDVVLDALQLVSFSENIILNLVGSGALTAHIRARVRALGFGSIVNFWGAVNNSQIDDVFRETDVLLLPSIWPENQPVSITEAMATRTPVIASAIGGIPELVVHGYSGYLFQPGSSADLAAKMQEFIANPDRIKRFGENGFKIISDKSFDRQLDQICALYK